MLFTIGHSNRTLLHLITIAKAHHIDIIADVRGGTSPGSRTFPHFNKDNLTMELPASGIEYIHFPELGGRRRKHPDADEKMNGEWRNPAFKNYADHALLSPEFTKALGELKLLGKHHNVAYMCSEAVPWRCHRSIITDYLLLVDNLEITHILGEKQTMKAKPHDHACLFDKKVMYPKHKIDTDILKF